MERRGNPKITTINLGLARVTGMNLGESESSLHFAIGGLGITGVSVHFDTPEAAENFLQMVGPGGSLRLQIVNPTILVGIDITQPPRHADKKNGFLPGAP
ncbi:hypothetical protein HYW44_01190 [Candidatus Daviesbacteria bacterium]|nr:hypothetical protein [Candidatus Daviesbacteria bacterium]